MHNNFHSGITKSLGFSVTVVSLKQASEPLKTRMVYCVGNVGFAIPIRFPVVINAVADAYVSVDVPPLVILYLSPFVVVIAILASLFAVEPVHVAWIIVGMIVGFVQITALQPAEELTVKFEGVLILKLLSKLFPTVFTS